MVKESDIIEINIPKRSINLKVANDEIDRRRKEMASRKNSWQPKPRKRKVSQALKAYAMMTTSAAHGAVRDVNQIKRKD